MQLCRKLGRTGFDVSGIGHGLWGMSGWSGSSDQESLAALQLAVDLGCNFFDTAWAYGEGKSDGLLGEIMARNPKKRLYAASKIPPANDRWPALPEYKYQDVFLAETCIQIRRQDPQAAAHRHDRSFAVSRVGRQLDQRARFPLHGGEAEARRLDSLFRTAASTAGRRKTASRPCAPGWSTWCR